MAVALDEFQTIAAFDGGNVEHALRAAVQEQRTVGYVFAGSEPSLMERHAHAARRSTRPGPVDPSSARSTSGSSRTFIDAKFARSGIRAEDGLGAAIVELAGNVPYGRAAPRARGLGRRAGCRTPVGQPRGSPPDPQPACLDEQHTVLRRSVAAASRSRSARVLRAIVLEEGRELLVGGRAPGACIGLPAASSVQSALAALQKQDIVMKERRPLRRQRLALP
jgi:hypothetical protein